MEITHVSDPNLFYNSVLCERSPIFFTTSASECPLSAALDCRHVAEPSVDSLQSAMTEDAVALRTFGDYSLIVVKQEGDDSETLQVLLQESAFQAAVVLYSVDLGLLRENFPFLLAKGPLEFTLRPGKHAKAFPHKILDNLYLGCIDCARNPILPDFIQCLVNASNLKLTPESKRIKYFDVNVWDDESQQINDFFVQSSDFIESAIGENKSVQVSCAAGVSRSTTLVLAYMILKLKMTLRSAYLHVVQRRSIVYPNSGFVRQLLQLEIDTLGKSSLPKPTSMSTSLDDLCRRQRNLEK